MIDMGKLKELHTISTIVKDILKQDKRARNSDMYLYIKVCEHINPDALTYPFVIVMQDLNAFNLPNFETVRRTRQKVQQCNPDLCADSKIEAHRTLNEEEFKKYARKVTV